MSFGKDLERLKATPPQPETKAVPPTAAEKAAPGTWDGSYRHNYFGGWQQSPIDIILRDAAGLTPNVDPRLTLSACLLMFSVLPCYTIADAGFQALMGMPEIDSEDERFKQLVEEMVWPEMRLFGEKVDRLTYTKGIEHIAKAMLSRTLSHGMGFWVALDEFQQIANDPKSQIAGVRICDPCRWEPLEFAPDEIEWVYTRAGQIYYMTRDAIAGVANLPSMRTPEGVWNKPLAYVGRYMSEFILKAVKGRGQTHVMKGAPVGITAISSDMPKDADPSELEKLQKLTNDNLAPIKAAYKEALQHATDTGRPADFIVTHAMPLRIESKVYGSESDWLAGFSDEFREFYEVICASTGWPVFLLSPPKGGGLNADNSDAQCRAALTRSEEHQATIGAEIRRITETACLRAKIRMPAKWDVKFHGGNFDDAKKMAEINKIQAEAAKIWAETFDMVFQSGGAQAAEQFADFHELEWLEGVSMRPVIESE